MNVDMLLWAMDHPPPTKMFVISSLQDGAFKDVVHQLHMPGGTTFWWLTFFLHISHLVCFQSSHNNSSNALQQ
jgi:hypothetical protein